MQRFKDCLYFLGVAWRQPELRHELLGGRQTHEEIAPDLVQRAAEHGAHDFRPDRGRSVSDGLRRFAHGTNLTDCRLDGLDATSNVEFLRSAVPEHVQFTVQLTKFRRH
jgi:hypothetical protein